MFFINDKVVKVDDYYITYYYDGYDTLEFDISSDNESFPLIVEHAPIKDASNDYVITKIDGNGDNVHVLAELDLQDFKDRFWEIYDDGSRTLEDSIFNFLPFSWEFRDQTSNKSRRTLRLEGCTALDLLKECSKSVLYGATFNFDTKNKILYRVNPNFYRTGGYYSPAFVTEELNLRSVNYYGDSSNLITRLVARGKDGLTFAMINGGLDYVENNTFTNDIIYGYWKDERYTDAEHLLETATEMLAELAVPARSYECDVIDLKSIYPEKYGAQDLSLYNFVSLKDIKRNTSVIHQIIQVRKYPHYPERNTVTLASQPPSISREVSRIEGAVAEGGGSQTIITGDITQSEKAALEDLRLGKVKDWHFNETALYNSNGSTTGGGIRLSLGTTSASATLGDIYIASERGDDVTLTRLELGDLFQIRSENPKDGIGVTTLFSGYPIEIESGNGKIHIGLGGGATGAEGVSMDSAYIGFLNASEIHMFDHIYLPNNIQIRSTRSDGYEQSLLRLNADNHVVVGALKPNDEEAKQGGAFMYGIYETTGSGSNVVVNSAGRLMVTGSSRRFKENITYDIDEEYYHNALMNFKAAEFNMKGDNVKKLGMIAEDVEEQCSIAALYEDEPIYADDGETVTGFKRTGNVNNYDDRAIIQMLVLEAKRLNLEIRRLNEIIKRNNLK